MLQPKLHLKILSVLMIIATLPLQWLYFFKVGGLAFKPVHLAIFILIGLLLVDEDYKRDFVTTIKQNSFLIVTYFGIVCLALVSTIWSSVGLAKCISNIFKMTVYGGFFMLFSSVLFNLWKQNQIRFHQYAYYSLLIFLIITWFIFWRLGRSFFVEFIQFFALGDTVKLRYDLFVTIFNYSFGANKVLIEGDELFRANLRHTIIAAFALVFALIQGFHKPKKLIGHILKWTACFVLIILILASSSRSGMLSLILVIIVAISLFAKTFTSKNVLIGVSALCVMALLLVLNWERLNPILSSTFERLSQIEQDARLELMAETVRAINQKWLLGHGLNTPLYVRYHEVQNHNFILGAWFQYGILGLIVSVAFYAKLLLNWVYAYIKQWKAGLSPYAPWIIAIMVIPLFRAMVSGNNGNFDMADWTAVCIFTAYVTKTKELGSTI
ncbi:MAG: O-antigen ligase family protein [Flavobacteriales bacterium]|nr:O-antigen ligase family protein [Flavobacteriales bacterium]